MNRRLHRAERKIQPDAEQIVLVAAFAGNDRELSFPALNRSTIRRQTNLKLNKVPDAQLNTVLCLPLATEVKDYEFGQLRRLDVTPGITGLWQVQARQGTPFESHIPLDMSYINNWNFWLDLKTIHYTFGDEFAGTGL